MIKIFHFLFFSFLESISDENLPCQVLFQYLRGKSDYFNVVFRLRLSAIAQFKNGRVQSKELGLAARDRKWRHMRTSGQTNGNVANCVCNLWEEFDEEDIFYNSMNSQNTWISKRRCVYDVTTQLMRKSAFQYSRRLTLAVRVMADRFSTIFGKLFQGLYRSQRSKF